MLPSWATIGASDDRPTYGVRVTLSSHVKFQTETRSQAKARYRPLAHRRLVRALPVGGGLPADRRGLLAGVEMHEAPNGSGRELGCGRGPRNPGWCASGCRRRPACPGSIEAWNAALGVASLTYRKIDGPSRSRGRGRAARSFFRLPRAMPGRAWPAGRCRQRSKRLKNKEIQNKAF